LTGLPPAYVIVSEFDPLIDEGVQYADRLNASGVPAELDRVAGAYHAFDSIVPSSPQAREMHARAIAATLRAVADR
jgi:acetyl esterase/lipase